jgi:ketosteroid isomerase-like protein
MLTPAGEVPPTGRTVDFTVCEVWQIRDGKVTSLHNYQDAASLMRQLGLLPEAQAA